MLREVNNQIKHWNQNRGPHAGWEAHFCKSRRAFHIARIHLLNIDIQNVIPTQGGKRIFATSWKSAATCRVHDMPKVKKLMNPLYVFRKARFRAFSPQRCSKEQNWHSHAAWGSKKKCFPPRTRITFLIFATPLARERQFCQQHLATHDA